MTILTSLLDYGSLVPTPTPSAFPPPQESTGSASSPLWAILVVGLGGGLLGGTGVYLGARRSSRFLRESAEKSLEHERTRLLNERFSTAAELLGHKEAACRLAGVHAMAGLADDWVERRQTCIGVLCAYLRMPYPSRPNGHASARRLIDWSSDREVRHTVIRTIREHLLPSTRPEASWIGYDLDFTGVKFDGGNFNDARFEGALVSFTDARFSGSFGFAGAEFSGGLVDFSGATFDGLFTFHKAKFIGGRVSFSRVNYAPQTVHFFADAEFSGGEVSFNHVEFFGGTVTFLNAKFRGGILRFDHSRLATTRVDFTAAEFTSGTVYLNEVSEWSPPIFDEGVLENPPPPLRLPMEEN